MSEHAFGGDATLSEYLVTEFVDGGTLNDWARQQKRESRDIVDLLTCARKNSLPRIES